ncbi:flagellar hook-associated protein FlgL [Candidatus Contendibacter odensensis]|uniref:Flagellar hook-associated protein n=1 Tax=Candidatus Contendobacter odensis Run_B_J11 TaxID=1400861 RepID=A0A7U7GEY8_9GAMM|nr:flagellar hook-associated protein FlgL [Candidatus Contendobacter odensis]CDH47148.1 putative Flagellar hook-associated protein [Candidatus Contendobacter odensis Run_B_J11]
MRISTSQTYRQGIKPITDHQVSLAKVQEQISSGRKILQPKDDPTNSARLMELHKQLTMNDQYGRNITLANGRLATEEGALQQGGDILQRARELNIQANSAALTDENRQSIAVEVRQLRQQLQDIANTKDSEGAYLFAGFKEQSTPFTLNANGDVIYNGDQGQRQLKIGPSRQIAVGDAGDDVFMNIRNNNGQFQVATSANNKGSGVISTGSVTDSVAFQNSFMGHDYRIDFTVNGANTTFNVIEVTNGIDNPTPVVNNQAYVAGQSISFRGMEVSISGTPFDDDKFTVEPSQNQSLFKTLDDLINALETPTKTAPEQAALTQSLANSLADIDQGMLHLNQIRGKAGSRMNSLDAQDAVNQTFDVQLQSLMGDIGAVNYAEAASQMNAELLGLQAAQQSFVKIQNLSLFNYLR